MVEWNKKLLCEALQLQKKEAYYISYYQDRNSKKAPYTECNTLREKKQYPVDAYLYHYEKHWHFLLFYFCKLASFMEERGTLWNYTCWLLKKKTKKRAQLLLAGISNNQTEKWTSYFLGRCFFLGLLLENQRISEVDVCIWENGRYKY